MKSSKGGDTVLIENPLCGNGSVSKALRLSDGEIPKWQTPDKARKEFGESRWRKATKMILVRDPVARFLSGSTLALNSTEDQLIEAGASPEFAHATAGLLSRKDNHRTLLLSFLSLMGDALAIDGWDGTEGLPTYLRPQSEWLTAKFDLVLATPNIAEYFNFVVKRCCLKSNNIHLNLVDYPIVVTASPEASNMIREMYAMDESTFSRLRVWSLDKSRIRLLNGYCHTGEAKRRAGEFDVLDLSEGEEPEGRLKKRKSRSKRKQARQARNDKT